VVDEGVGSGVWEDLGPSGCRDGRKGRCCDLRDQALKKMVLVLSPVEGGSCDKLFARLGALRSAGYARGRRVEGTDPVEALSHGPGLSGCERGKNPSPLIYHRALHLRFGHITH
jgi:hypothetical protein